MNTKKTPRTFPFNKDDMSRAVEVLRQGGVILYPTDTIWGIGCDATNPDAVRRVYDIKRRSDSKALIVLANSDAMISNYVEQAPEVAWNIIELATKPTTVIFDKGRNLAPNLLAADGSIAFRLTHEDYSSQLCFHLRKPIVSTSANISGEPSPRFYSEISQEIIDQVDYVAHYRQNDHTPSSPSSIIKIGNHNEVKIIR